jgi:hypothetical protein
LENADEIDGVLWGSPMHREVRLRQGPSPSFFAMGTAAGGVNESLFAANTLQRHSYLLDRSQQKSNAN